MNLTELICDIIESAGYKTNFITENMISFNNDNGDYLGEFYQCPRLLRNVSSPRIRCYVAHNGGRCDNVSCLFDPQTNLNIHLDHETDTYVINIHNPDSFNELRNFLIEHGFTKFKSNE